MKKQYFGGLSLFLVMLIFLSYTPIYGQSNRVVTLGNDLNQEQQKQMLRIFDVMDQEVKRLVVTNDEEREYLQGVATEAQIGTRAISSAYVEGLSAGDGIQVETYNITWVTKEMFQNALLTAGVKDAKIIAAAPFNVSGTAALTGILKAFEEMTGKPIDEDKKQIANEEIVKTGRLGEEIGRDKASRLVQEVKQEIIDKNVQNPEEIKRIIIDIAGRLDINLNTDQINDLSGLMERINRLNLNTEEMRQQLESIGRQLGEIAEQNKEVKSILDRILEFIKRIFDSILGMVKRSEKAFLWL